MSRHTISHAGEIFFQEAQYNPAFGAKRGVPMTGLRFVDLGTPALADDNLLLDDEAAEDAVLEYTVFLAQPDVPRTLVATGTAGSNHVITITGLDEYGEIIVENLTLNGTTPDVGLKAFASVSLVSVAVGATGDTFDLGTTDAIGLPFRINAGDLIMPYFAGLPDLTTSAVPGTIVPAVTTDPATAITGDVRGTYDPVGTLNGSIVLGALIKWPDNVTSKVLAYGVDQFGG
jgi:hypothetical protein